MHFHMHYPNEKITLEYSIILNQQEVLNERQNRKIIFFKVLPWRKFLILLTSIIGTYFDEN